MRSLNVSEDVVPAKEFKAKLSSWLAHVAENRRPVLITLNGKPAGVLLDPRDFEQTQERERFVASVRRGMDDAEAGRFVTEKELDKILEAATGRSAK